MKRKMLGVGVGAVRKRDVRGRNWEKKRFCRLPSPGLSLCKHKLLNLFVVALSFVYFFLLANVEIVRIRDECYRLRQSFRAQEVEKGELEKEVQALRMKLDPKSGTISGRGKRGRMCIVPSFVVFILQNDQNL